jgi:hypothetical protein
MYAESANVESRRSLVVVALLGLQSGCALAASYASKHDPVGEKVYASGTLWRMVPLAVIATGLILA